MQQKARKESPRLTAGLLAEGLKNLGLGRGDIVFMHSSLKDLAPAGQLLALPEMGMPLVLEALKEMVGPEGLIAVPTLTSCFVKSSVGPTGEIWDKKTTPSRVGVITNYLLRQRGVRRSDHPSHSIAALGHRAAEFVEGHAWNAGSTFHRGGPWGRLCEWDAKILFLGTYLSTCTLVHCVEDWMGLPYLESSECLILDENRDVRIVTVTGSPTGPRDFYNSRDTKLEKKFAGAGFYKTGRVCMAEVTLFKARDLVCHLWRWLEEDPWLLLKTDKSDPWSQRAGKAAEKHLAAFGKPCPWA